MKIRVRVSTSRIAGQGLFAGQDIKKGIKIIQYMGEKILREESERRLAAGSVYIFGLNERDAIDGHTPKNTARYSNHSCDPNCHTEQFGNTPSGLWRSRIFGQARNSPIITAMMTKTMKATRAIAAHRIVVATFSVRSIGTASSSQHLSNVSSCRLERVFPQCEIAL